MTHAKNSASTALESLLKGVALLHGIDVAVAVLLARSPGEPNGICMRSRGGWTIALDQHLALFRIRYTVQLKRAQAGGDGVVAR